MLELQESQEFRDQLQTSDQQSQQFKDLGDQDQDLVEVRDFVAPVDYKQNLKDPLEDRAQSQPLILNCYHHTYYSSPQSILPAKPLTLLHPEPTLLTSQKISTLPYPTPEFYLTSEPPPCKIVRFPIPLNPIPEPIVKKYVSIEIYDKLDKLVSVINIVPSSVRSRINSIRVVLKASSH